MRARLNIEATDLRRALSRYPTGVTVVTGLSDEGWPIGLTIGSFTSVSLDPPLVGFLPTRGSSAWEEIACTGSFCVNVLSHEQGDLCRQFATGRGERFSDIGWRPAPSGSPILDDVLAWIDCSTERVIEAGDHWFVMGRVQAHESRDGLPIVFFGGALDTLRVQVA